MWRMTWNSSWMPLPPCMSRGHRSNYSALPVARHPRDVERLAAAVALDERHHLGGGLAFVHQAAHAQAALQAQRDLGLHVGQLLLHELVGGERAPELLA